MEEPTQGEHEYSEVEAEQNEVEQQESVLVESIPVVVPFAVEGTAHDSNWLLKVPSHHEVETTPSETDPDDLQALLISVQIEQYETKQNAKAVEDVIDGERQ